MTTNITLLDKSANEILDLVRELRAQGSVQGKDFDFAFTQGGWNEMTGDYPNSTVFTFYTDKYATLFALKYYQ